MNPLYRDEKWLRDKYLKEEWSFAEIAIFCDVTPGTISNWIKKFGIKTRNYIESHTGIKNGNWIESKVKDRIWLYNQYVLEKKPLAKENGVSSRTVARYIEKFNIPTRSKKDYPAIKGEEHYKWKGGSFCINCGRSNSRGSLRCSFCHFNFLRENPQSTPGYKGYRNISCVLRSALKEWTQEVFARDNYVCQECGDNSGGNLQAHHLIPFATIRDQIIIENFDLDLSTEEGRLELVSRVKNDKRFSDVTNGITLCDKCHRGEHCRIRSHWDNLLFRYRAEVLEVKDGDTLLLEVDLGFSISTKIEARLFGINTPELKGETRPDGLRVKNIVEQLCMPGKSIIIRTFKPGKYGRWLVLIVLSDSIELNSSMLEQGLAREYDGRKS